jgi:hypothetical protein
MIKVEVETNKETGVSTFVFETNNQDDLTNLDLLKVAFLGTHPKRGMFPVSNKLVIEAKVPVVELS